MLVKWRDDFGKIHIREGRVLDCERDCVKLEHRFFGIFCWSKWYSIKDDRGHTEVIFS
jgi:hypothetical protein